MSSSQSCIVDKKLVSESSVLVVGDAMLDQYWFGNVDRISPEAPVPVVRVRRVEYRLGGGANVSRNIAAVGAKVTLLSIVGDDEAGSRLSTMLAENGIAPKLIFDPAISTTVKLRIIGHQQQLLRADFEESPSEKMLLRLDELFRELVGQHDVIVFSDYGKGTLLRANLLISVASAAGRPVFVDPKGADYAIYSGATLITPNRRELEQIVGNWDDDGELARKALELRERLRLEAILVTRSEEGMSLYDQHGELRVESDALEVFDVTGAGDTVIAVLATLSAAGLKLRDAVPLANRAGGLVVGRFGTSAVSYDDLFDLN